MRDHIITGYDGSTVSAAAATWAADEALRREVGLTVVGCYSAPTMTNFGGSFLSAANTALRDATQAHVDQLAADLSRSHPGLTVNGCANSNRPSTVLALAAARRSTANSRRAARQPRSSGAPAEQT